MLYVDDNTPVKRREEISPEDYEELKKAGFQGSYADYLQYKRTYGVQPEKKHLLIDPYAGELNTERISTYMKLSEKYHVSDEIAMNIFCAGVDWCLNKIQENK